MIITIALQEKNALTNIQSRAACRICGFNGRATKQIALQQNCTAQERRVWETKCRAGGNLVWIPKCKLALAREQNFGVYQIIETAPLNPFSSLFFSFSQKPPAPLWGGSVSQKRSPCAAKLVLTRNWGLSGISSWTSWLGQWSVCQGPLSAGGSSVAFLPCSLPPVKHPSTECLSLNWDQLEWAGSGGVVVVGRRQTQG